MEQSEALLKVARAAHERGEIGEAKQLHLEILSLYPRTAEAEAAVHYLTGGYLMPADEPRAVVRGASTVEDR